MILVISSALPHISILRNKFRAPAWKKGRSRLSLSNQLPRHQSIELIFIGGLHLDSEETIA